MARPEGFEPPTTWFEARYSIQLSYGRAATRILLQPTPPQGADGRRSPGSQTSGRRNPARNHDFGHKSPRFPPQRSGIPTPFAYVIRPEGLKNPLG